MKTLLSIDYDFFIREEPAWDFGHNETNSIFMDTAWLARYLSVDLYKETDIKKYADFLPEQIINKLEWLGFKLNKPSIIVADSHKYAFEVVKSLKGCQVFNFDAHHDCYEDTPKISCANWLGRSIISKYASKVTWVLPSWLRRLYSGIYKILKISLVEGKFFDNLNKNEFKGIKIDTIFICRSGCWVPPHHDSEFFRMVETLKSLSGNFVIAENISQRKFPTKKKALKLFEENEEAIKKLHIPKSSVSVYT